MNCVTEIPALLRYALGSGTPLRAKVRTGKKLDMGNNDNRLAWLVAALVLAGSAGAQDAPSWRALEDKPKRPDVPPEVERPEYEFSVSREQLQGFSMPVAPPSGQQGERSGSTEPAARAPELTVDSSDRRVPIVETAPPVAINFTPEPTPMDPAELDLGTGPASDFRLVTRRTVDPEYPLRAYREGVEGWVYLKVTVDPSGTVEGVEVIDADPLEVFDASAVRAVRQWRFEPPRLAGVTTPQSKLYRISFQLDED